MTGVWVLGGGGHAKVVVATLQSAGNKIAGVFDEDAGKKGLTLLSAKIEGRTPDPDWWRAENRSAIVAIGNNATRQRVAELPAQWMTATHPEAHAHSSVLVGCGSLICAGVVVQPDVKIGKHVIANTSCSIDHDCVIGDFAHIAPGVTLAGEVRIGDRTFVGAGATIIQGVTVGPDAVIGAGAVVISDIAEGQKVAGVPARSLSHD
ncbi:MAG: acetyltransferase [Rhodobiaceae bacterium]|nr:acetyltransferase [Rhodobiaceae bacterium]